MPILMVVLSLLLTARVNRILTVTVSLACAITVAASCIGETWAYYLVGGLVEIVLLLFIARTALKWPRETVMHPTAAALTDQAHSASSANGSAEAHTARV